MDNKGLQEQLNDLPEDKKRANLVKGIEEQTFFISRHVKNKTTYKGEIVFTTSDLEAIHNKIVGVYEQVQEIMLRAIRRGRKNEENSQKSKTGSELWSTCQETIRRLNELFKDSSNQQEYSYKEQLEILTHLSQILVFCEEKEKKRENTKKDNKDGIEPGE